MLVSLLLASEATAQTTRPALSALLGFSGVFKPDAWTPIYARVTDADGPRAATLEVRAARGKLGHDVVTRIATNTAASTYTLYAPIGTLDRVSLQLRDERGDLLRSVDLTDAAQATPAALGGPAFGVASDSVDAQRVVNQLFNDTEEYVAAGGLATNLLPERPIGYSCVDVLVLPSLDVDAIDDGVQAAIVAWVRAGGVVVTWPGVTSPTRSAPLVNALPATIGEPAEVVFDGRSIVGRKILTKPNVTDAIELAPTTILERRLGLGQIVQLAFDPTRLPDTSKSDRVALWRRLTSGQFSMSPDDRRVGVFDPLVAQAVGEQQLAPANIEATSPMKSIVIAGLVVGILLGPGELLLLAASRRHPRTWYTLAGLALTIGCGAGWIAMPTSRQAQPQKRIDVRLETTDGLDASIAIATSPDAQMDAAWLTADRTDPSLQPAAELALAQRESNFDVTHLTPIGSGTPKVRAIRFSTEELHPAHLTVDLDAATVTNVSMSTWDSLAIIHRGGVQMEKATVKPGESWSFAKVQTMLADNPSTRRVETGIERLAAEPGWAAILMDRRLSERLVRLLETEETTIVAAHSADGTAITLHVIRR